MYSAHCGKVITPEDEIKRCSGLFESGYCSEHCLELHFWPPEDYYVWHGPKPLDEELWTQTGNADTYPD